MMIAVSPRISRLLFYSGIVIIAGVIITGIISFLLFYNDFHSKQRLVNRENTGLLLLDRTGKPFYNVGRTRNFTYIPLSQIPLSIQQALISSEDKNFYKDPGFSLSGIFRAFFTDITHGTLQQGGSGISQQLVKNTLLSPQRSFTRKYEEIVLSYLLNLQYSKKDILEMYLNTTYFGEGAYGVEDAAQVYFGEHASQLTLAQSALLVGLLPSPSAYSPLSNNPAIAKAHQKDVLGDMVAIGAITQQEATTAGNETLAYNHSPQPASTTYGTQFALMVQDELYKKYGKETVLNQGYTVTTTLNSSWQQFAETVVQNQVANLIKDNTTNGAAVVLDPRTGQILSLVGSHNWDDPINGKVNMAITPRQSGSAFKPIVYSEAFAERLITPETILEDVPTTFPGNYKPHDYDYKYRGPVTVRRALANSLNIPAVEVMQKVGVADALSQAQNLGITTLQDPSQYGLSLILGTGPVPLLQLTNAYATFANNGVYATPQDILQIKDKYGDVIQTFQPDSREAIDPGVAFLITSILSDNKARAEEFGNLLTIPRPAAVKTGTTEDFRDSLTVGYTPYLTIGVWVGNNNNVPMDNVAGSLGAAPIWKQLMEHFSLSYPPTAFAPPSDVVKATVCQPLTPSTKTATQSAMVSDYFLLGTQPTTECLFPTVSPTSPTDTVSPTVTPQMTLTQPPTPTDITPTQMLQPTTVTPPQGD